MTPLYVNQNVNTPNGPGVVDGKMYANGAVFIRVRHTLKEMTGRDRGVCLTPNAQISGVWYYDQHEVWKP